MSPPTNEENTVNIFNIRRAYVKKKSSKWEKIYWFVDFHDTICKADYGDESKMHEFYPNAERVLQHLSKKEDVALILWTCSHSDDIQRLVEWLRMRGITFQHVNDNPEVVDSRMSCYGKKPYMNVVLDDKAGFCGEDGDWFLVEAELKAVGEWDEV